MGDWRRTHSCGELTEKDTAAEVLLMGWVARRRDHGGVIFVDLRDRKGITQIVFNETAPKAQETADALRSEYVIAVTGKVSPRPEGMINENLYTGRIEIIATDIRILNTALTPPFLLDEFDHSSEDVRLKYRYLDLRRASMQKNLFMRHNITRLIREYLNSKDFLDIETPFLTVSTPEGARDYLVPSRVNPGMFYALPQSPQQFKQLFMVGGMERYYQIVRCFRDEDLRADRQPEFTQLDIEMSFIGRNDIVELIEPLFALLFKEILNADIPRPFPVLSYADAMERFGHDAPDTRFALHLSTINHLVKDCGFGVFAEAAKTGSVKAINAKGAADKLSRKDIEALTAFVTELGAKGLAYIKINPDSLQSPLIKFLGEDPTHKIVEYMGGEAGDIIFFGAGNTKLVNLYMSKLRIELAGRLGLIKPDTYALTWVFDFPLLEWSEEERRYTAVHHPFTSPLESDIPLLSAEPQKVRANAYDLVLNGTEIGGGSIRIHQSDLQKQLFSLMGFSDEELEKRFGYFIDALKYGTPPHGGIAFGIDRICAIFTGSESIRDVIAFPKTQKATDVMCGAPNYVDEKQLRELHIRSGRIKTP
jgi:aspartyl-tRNA synthetase